MAIASQAGVCSELFQKRFELYKDDSTLAHHVEDHLFQFNLFVPSLCSIVNAQYTNIFQVDF